MLVSVIIPVYNAGDRLLDAIASAFTQDHRPIELVVVDDGSTDDVPLRLRSLQDQVRLIQQPNRGVASARNLGLREARGDYIHFLDADDSLSPDAVSSKLRMLIDNPVADVCMNPYRCVGSNGVVDAESHVKTPLGDIDCPTGDLLYTAVRRFPMSLCGMLVPRRTWDMVAPHEGGPFDENLRQGCDARFLFGLAMKRVKVVGVDRLLTTVNLSRRSLTADQTQQRRYNGHVLLKNLIDLLCDPPSWPYVGTMLRWYWGEALQASLDASDLVAMDLRHRLAATIGQLELLAARAELSLLPLVRVLEDHCARRADIAMLLQPAWTRFADGSKPGPRDVALWLSPSFPSEFTDTNHAAIELLRKSSGRFACLRLLRTW